MFGNMAQGVPFIVAGFMAFVTLIVWMVKNNAMDNDGFRDLLANLNLEQIVTLQALTKSVLAFIIVGLVLWSMP